MLKHTLTGINDISELCYSCSFSELIDFNIDIGQNNGIQRTINDDIVNNIIQNIKEHKVYQGIYVFTFSVLDDGVKYLVDGQHRFTALKKLSEEKYFNPDNIQCIVKEINVSNQEQALKLSQEIGLSNPVKPISCVTEQANKNCFTKWLKNSVNKPHNSKTPRYGNYPHDLVDTLHYYGFFKQFASPQIMLNLVNELNNWLFKYRLSKKHQKFMCSDISKFTKAEFLKYCEYTDGQVMSLQLLLNYGFIEVISVMNKENKTVEELYTNNTHFNFNNRNIDKKTRKAVEKHFFNEDNRKCPVCMDKILKYNDKSSYQIGHIIAHSRGGHNCQDNLIPICHQCNSCCGDENLMEFCLRVYNRELDR